MAKRSLKGTDLRKGTAFPRGEDLDFSLNLSFRFLANYLSTSNRRSGSWELRRDGHQGYSCMMLRENEILTFLVLTQHPYQRSPWQQVGREPLRTVSAKGPVLPSRGPRLQPSSGGLQTARKRLDFCGVGRGVIRAQCDPRCCKIRKPWHQPHPHQCYWVTDFGSCV